jgi:hypothetical protein
MIMLYIIIPRLKYSVDDTIQCKIKEVIISDNDNNSCNEIDYIQSHNMNNAYGKYALKYVIIIIQ